MHSALAVELSQLSGRVPLTGCGISRYRLLDRDEIVLAELDVKRYERVGQAPTPSRTDDQHDVVAGRS